MRELSSPCARGQPQIRASLGLEFPLHPVFGAVCCPPAEITLLGFILPPALSSRGSWTQTARNSAFRDGFGDPKVGTTELYDFAGGTMELAETMLT